jgi:exonuclease SbcC
MRVRSIEHVGTEAFPEPIAIDFDQLPDILVACGPVGSGKTTFLDLIAASLYLTMPYRSGPLHASFSKLGYVRLHFSHRGKDYHTVLTVDPKAKKTEAQLYENDQLIGGPTQKTFLAKVLEIFGPLDLFLVTSYAAQYSQTSTVRPVTFMGIERADRRAVMASMLGLERYEQKKALADLKVAETTKRLDAVRVRKQGVEQAAASVRDLTERAAAAATQVETAQQAVEWARLSLDDVQQKVVSQAGVTDVLSRLDEMLPKAQRKKQDLTIRVTTLRTPIVWTPVDVSDIEVAEAAVQACEQELVSLDRKLDVARNAGTGVATAEGKIRERKALLDELPILERVPCKGIGEYAGCPFITRAVDIREREASLSSELVTLTEMVETLRDESARQLTIMSERDARRRQISTTNAEIAKKRNAALDAERVRLREEARVAQLTLVEGELTVCTEELETMQAERTEILAVITPGLQQEAAEAGAKLREAEASHRTAIQQQAQFDERLTTALTAATDLARHIADEARLQNDVEEWSIVAKGLGPTGIPALRVDLALPGISELATQKLRECFGEGTWEIKIVSQKPSAAHGLLETLEVVVIRRGKEIEADRLSGGESVIINEAVSLALAMYRGTREASWWEPGLIMRDEAASALGDLAPAYIEMFRSLIKQGGATQVLLVSHQPDVIERADARLRFGGGKVRVA